MSSRPSMWILTNCFEPTSSTSQSLHPFTIGAGTVKDGDDGYEISVYSIADPVGKTRRKEPAGFPILDGAPDRAMDQLRDHQSLCESRGRPGPKSILALLIPSGCGVSVGQRSWSDIQTPLHSPQRALIRPSASAHGIEVCGFFSKSAIRSAISFFSAAVSSPSSSHRSGLMPSIRLASREFRPVRRA